MELQNALAPFGKRLWAFILDLFVLGIVMLMAQFTIPYILPFFVWVGYKAIFECSAIQATPGKRAVGLMVTDAHGNRITFGVSLLRTFVAFVSVSTGFLIYLVALFTPRRQSVHDLIASTLVVENKPEADPFKAWGDEVTVVYRQVKHALTNAPPQSAPYLAEKEKLELIEKLHQLKSQGALTVEEFEARKKAILQ
jgi:uncharacterized RDD family membrane protein YckC